MVTFYDNSLHLFEVSDHYFIIGSHAYQDARALHGQLVMYVLKHFYTSMLVIH